MTADDATATTTASSDRDPVEVLYREQRAAMVRLAHLLTGSNAAAQDLVQDAFVKVAPRLRDSTRPLDHPAAYLRRSVVNHCTSWHRRRAVEARHATVDAEPLALGPELDEMWALLRTLPPKRRTALVLRFYADLSYDAIAETMDVRPGTVRSLIHRGLASLREELSDAHR